MRLNHDLSCNVQPTLIAMCTGRLYLIWFQLIRQEGEVMDMAAMCVSVCVYSKISTKLWVVHYISYIIWLHMSLSKLLLSSTVTTECVFPVNEVKTDLILFPLFLISYQVYQLSDALKNNVNKLISSLQQVYCTYPLSYYFFQQPHSKNLNTST